MVRPPHQFLAKFVAGHVLPQRWKLELATEDGEPHAVP